MATPGSKPVGREPRGPMAPSSVTSRIMAIEKGNEQVQTAVNLRERRGAGSGDQFPQNIIRRDPRDTDKKIKTKLIGPGGVGTPFGQATLEQSDIDWMKRKQAAVEEARFYEWLNLTFDKEDLSQWNAVDKAFPENTQRQLDYVNRVADLQKQVVRIKTLPMNAWSKDDYYFLYLIKTNRINVPEQPLHRLDRVGKDRTARYRRGLFNFKRNAPQGADSTNTVRDLGSRGVGLPFFARANGFGTPGSSASDYSGLASSAGPIFPAGNQPLG